MNKTEALGFYHGLMRFGIKPGLERISVLLHRLGDPQKSLKFIHVAGTNGKGSVCTELSFILKEAGYKTGLYTSPYIIDFCERIQINNKFISDPDLCRYTEIIKKLVLSLESEGVVITEFEAITAAAFLYFAESGCDIVVLETGLGGRYDATNVIESNLLSIITTVSLDHTGILGDTVQEIAGEKCGIFKPGCPVLYEYSQSEEYRDVILKTAAVLNCPVYDTRDYPLEIVCESFYGTDVLLKGKELHVPFSGENQVRNSQLVIAAVDILKENGFSVGDDALSEGLKKAFIPARTEVISFRPGVILDGCHNPESTYSLKLLLDRFFAGKKVLGVCSMMKDKDCKCNFENLGSCFHKVICTEADNPRRCPADELSTIGDDFVPCIAVPDKIHAIDLAVSESPEYDCVVYFGSLYFASDIRNILLKKYKKED